MNRARTVVAPSSGEAAVTRRRILEAAKRLIAIQGFNATTVRQIARKVSMKGGSLYYHFGGKEEILFAIFDEGNRLLIEAAEGVLAMDLRDARAILKDLIQAHMRILASDPAQFMVVTRELNHLKGEGRARIMAQRSKYEHIVQCVLQQGIKEGTIKPCNTKIVSYGLIAWLNGVTFWFNPRGPLSIERIAQEYSRILLEGLQARAA